MRYKTRFAALLIVAALAVMMAMIVGCSNGTSASSAASDASASASSAESASGEASAASEATDQAKSEGSAAASSEVPESSAEVHSFNAKLPVGDLLAPKIDEPEVMTDSEVEEAERAIRAYTPSESEEALLINEAPSFYFYDKLDGDAKAMYNAILSLVEDPTNDDYTLKASLKDGASQEDVYKSYLLARMAVQYDHPELFWIYQGLETEVDYNITADGSTFYMTLTRPYKNYDTEMKAFNDAAESFLADIDKNQSQVQIARDIHDKLTAMVTYDYDVAERHANDLAHTAYGALVANSNGDPNTAVCDGYSQAYVYLLQQCGVNAAVILGYAGTTETEMGGHTWSVVELDGDWYEVDSTFDDVDKAKLSEEMEELRAENPGDEELEALFKRVDTMLADEGYMEKVRHYQFNLTTKEIEAYTAPESMYYTFEDGESMTLALENVHVREQDADQAVPQYAYLMELAPVATGTKYAYVG